MPLPGSYLFNEGFANGTFTKAPIFKANPNRVAWIVSNAGTSVFYMSTLAGGPNTSGIAIAPNNTVILRYCDVGDLVQAAWFVTTSAPNTGINDFEITENQAQVG